MAAVLEVHDLEKSFGGVVAAHNINVLVEEGETVGVIGANGAGKTTFINMVTGWLQPSGGNMMIMGGTLLIIIMFLPDGLWSLVERYNKRKNAAKIAAAGETQAAE